MPNLIPYHGNLTNLMGNVTLRKAHSKNKRMQNPGYPLSFLDNTGMIPLSGYNVDSLLQYKTTEKPPHALSYLNLGETIPSSAYSLDLPVEAPVVIDRTFSVVADSTPLQIWEGIVLELSIEENVMHVMLNAKLNSAPRHSADIDLEWVSDQDKNLVTLGAVFYLTLFKRTRHGTIENSQELRFRRRPSWTQKQMNVIEEESAMLLAKMKPLPTVE